MTIHSPIPNPPWERSFRFDTDSLQLEDTFMFTGGPNTNYTGGAFDPVTGNWFVSTTNAAVLEIDPVTQSVLSETILGQFVPASPFGGPQQIQAFAFGQDGRRVILGGNFGLIQVDRTILAPTAGDTNGDGVVDLKDLDNVRNHFGSAGLGDADSDNDVDLDDLNAVRNNFGAGSANHVPEPSSLALLALGAAGGVVRRRTGRR